MTDQTVYQFDAAGRLVSMTDCNGNQTQHVYENDRLTNWYNLIKFRRTKIDSLNHGF
ncbi:MAG: RHS repeat domain-containing protein [Aeoliella sp.]